jgi:hypothetical protein
VPTRGAEESAPLLHSRDIREALAVGGTTRAFQPDGSGIGAGGTPSGGTRVNALPPVLVPWSPLLVPTPGERRHGRLARWFVAVRGRAVVRDAVHVVAHPDLAYIGDVPAT